MEMPQFIQPQLSTLVHEAPSGDKWLHEQKYDGYRMLCRIENGKARLITRYGNDWTDQYPRIAQAAARLPVKSAWLDGEIALFKDDGTTSFDDLQQASGNDPRLRYAVFDVLILNGKDLRKKPLLERKRLLEQLIPSDDGFLLYASHIVGHGDQLREMACQTGAEGIVSKRVDSPYRSGRGSSWIKVKCKEVHQFVVGGYTESTAGNLFGSLLVGRFKGEALEYVGKVAVGLSAQRRATLLEKMAPLEQPASPFVDPPHGVKYRNPHWLRPQLVVDVETLLTEGGKLRHSVYVGVSRKTVQELRTVPAGVSIPADRIVYPDEAITFTEVQDYYRMVAHRLLPHVIDRPLWIVRCPEGIQGPCKCKRHANDIPGPARAIQIPGHREPYFTVDSTESLLSLLQVGMVEIHSWQSRYSRLEFPDRIVFDLDPGEGVSWEEVIAAALLVRERLRPLESFVQVTGRKGCHIHVPLAPIRDWQTVIGFCRRFAEELAAEMPKRFVARSTLALRKGRIYLDWMRNGRGANSIDAYSLRSTPRATVACPISWEELKDGIAPDAFTLRRVSERLKQADPWDAYFEIEQPLPSR